jgi:hypothetical protein
LLSFFSFVGRSKSYYQIVGGSSGHQKGTIDWNICFREYETENRPAALVYHLDRRAVEAAEIFPRVAPVEPFAACT